MDHLTYITSIGVLLLAGLICSIVSKKMKIPNILLLILTGIGLSQIEYTGRSLIHFPPAFLTSMGILALAIIVFESSTKLKLREFDTFSLKTLKLTVVILILNFIFLSLFTSVLFKIQALLVSMIFAATMSGTSPEAVLTLMKNTKSRAGELIKIESIINTPVTVLVPFIILDVMRNFGTQPMVTTMIDQIGPFFQQVVTGIGSGVFVGLILFKVMRKQYSEDLSPIATIVAALMTYVLAENLGGNGVLAVTTLGLVFGNIALKGKASISEYAEVFAHSLEILVFILVGLIVRIPTDWVFLLKSIGLLGVYLTIRFLAILITLRNEKYNYKEITFMTLNAPKGIAVAVVALMLSSSVIDIQGMKTILDLTLLFLLHSIVLSTIVIKFSGRLLGAKNGN